VLLASGTDAYAKKAGIAHVHPHVLRHTFATRYLAGGSDIYILSKILGHASVTMTERVYAHLLKEDLYQRSQHIQLGGVVTGGGDSVSAA
jgi:integrase